MKTQIHETGDMKIQIQKIQYTKKSKRGIWRYTYRAGGQLWIVKLDSFVAFTVLLIWCRSLVATGQAGEGRLGINCNCRGVRKLAEVGLMDFFIFNFPFWFFTLLWALLYPIDFMQGHQFFWNYSDFAFYKILSVGPITAEQGRVRVTQFFIQIGQKHIRFYFLCVSQPPGYWPEK